MFWWCQLNPPWVNAAVRKYKTWRWLVRSMCSSLLLLPKLFVNNFINFGHLLTLCYLVTFLRYLRTLYMYLLYTSDSTPHISVSAPIRLSNSKGAFVHRAILIWRGSRHGWVFSPDTTLYKCDPLFLNEPFYERLIFRSLCQLISFSFR